MNIIFIGASGSGKGTQAKILQEKYGFCHISTGDLLREYTQNGSELGKKALEYMNAGKWVPIEIVLGLLNKKIEDSKGYNGFILDGFPRNLDQAKALQIKIDIVFNMKNDLDGLVRRLTERRTCKVCGKILSVHTLKKGNCSECGGEVFQRSDDNKETILARFNSFDTETKPLIEYYGKMGIVHDIDADMPIEEVSKQIERVIKNGLN